MFHFALFLETRVLMGVRAHSAAAAAMRQYARPEAGVQPITGQAEITEHDVNFTFSAPDQAFRN